MDVLVNEKSDGHIGRWANGQKKRNRQTDRQTDNLYRLLQIIEKKNFTALTRVIKNFQLKKKTLIKKK